MDAMLSVDVMLSVNVRTMLSHAQGLKKFLQDNGYTVFLCDQMDPGEEWRTTINFNAKHCKVFLAFINSAWCESRECGFEFNIAVRNNLLCKVPYIYPLLLEEFSFYGKYPSVDGLLCTVNALPLLKEDLNSNLWQKIVTHLRSKQVVPSIYIEERLLTPPAAASLPSSPATPPATPPSPSDPVPPPSLPAATVPPPLSPTAVVSPDSPIISDRLISGTAKNSLISTGENFIRSRNGVYTFIIQADRNLVLYQLRLPSWATNTWLTHKFVPPYKVTLLENGNLVVYDGNGDSYWSTNTASKGTAPFSCVVENSGHVVIYDSLDRAIWKCEKTVAHSLLNFFVKKDLFPIKD